MIFVILYIYKGILLLNNSRSWSWWYLNTLRLSNSALFLLSIFIHRKSFKLGSNTLQSQNTPIMTVNNIVMSIRPTFKTCILYTKQMFFIQKKVSILYSSPQVRPVRTTKSRNLLYLKYQGR